MDRLETLDNVTDFDTIPDFDFLGAVDITGGHYDFASKLDLGGKQPLRLKRHFVTQGFYPNDLIDKKELQILILGQILMVLLLLMSTQNY